MSVIRRATPFRNFSHIFGHDGIWQRANFTQRIGEREREIETKWKEVKKIEYEEMNPEQR